MTDRVISGAPGADTSSLDARRSTLDTALPARPVPQPRPGYDGLTLYSPGVDACAIDLSDNTNLWGAPPAAARAVREGVASDGPGTLTRYPVLYANARRGLCRRTHDGEDEPLLPLFEEILRTIPAPRYDDAHPLQFLVTMLDYDDYLGRLALGRVVNGVLRKGHDVAQCHPDGSSDDRRITGLYGYEGLRRVEIQEARPGDIVSVSGLESVTIGETLSDRDVACGVVDVKSFYMETPEDVAERVRRCLDSIPAERLSLVPDCGFFPVPRWVAFEKLKRLAAGVALARKRLQG